jgi:hypothetical protein
MWLRNQIFKFDDMAKTTQQTLADHLQKMQNLLTMDCMKYWRSAGENRLTPDEALKILETLKQVAEIAKYSKNCCHHIFNGWEERDETATSHN